MMYRLLICLTISILVIGCSDYFLTIKDCIYDKDTHSTEDVISKNHPAIINMVNRAKQISQIEWTPIYHIPHRSGMFSAGQKQTGLPYSSVKEKDKFVGQEVSFHTFMTAVHNPRSVIYTEQVNEAPYNGVNCDIYYGTVCSMAVNYALGIERPYDTSQYSQLADFTKVTSDDPNMILDGDILLSPGHVVLVIDIQKKGNRILSVEILESSGIGTKIKNYTYAKFIERWNNDKWVAYRYLNLEKNVKYVPIPFVHLNNDNPSDFIYNDDICVSRGDKACYCKGEDIIINILNTSFTNIELYRDDCLYVVDLLEDKQDYILKNLPEGLYKARLFNSSIKSDFTYFEIIDTDVTVQTINKGHVVYFQSNNGYPEYIVTCTITGARSTIKDITEDERLVGAKIIPEIKDNEYIKVFFRGDYGRISNKPIPIQ